MRNVDLRGSLLGEHGSAMEQNVAERLRDAVRAFNIRVKQARERGVPFLVETACAGRGGDNHIHVLRTVPVSGNVPLEIRDSQCAAEIALFCAAGEINRLADDARRQDLALELKVEGTDERSQAGWVSLVIAELQGR